MLCQFTDKANSLNLNKKKDGCNNTRKNLSNFIKHKDFYAAGRLDYNSEGLVILTNNGALQNKISNPSNKMEKLYFVQVEGILDKEKLKRLRKGIHLKDGMTLPTKLQKFNSKPNFWERQPEVPEYRANNSHWYRIILREGKNRQIRRMFANIGHPVLRLIRQKIGPWDLGDMLPGQFKILNINLPSKNIKNR